MRGVRTWILTSVALLVVAGLVAAGPLVKGRRWRSQDAQNPMDALAEPGELATLADFLVRMGYDKHLINETAGYILVRVRGRSGIHSLYLVPQGELIHLRVPRLLRVPRGAVSLPAVQRRLLELNWLNLVGKYSWDLRDGEVRYAYTLVAPDGVSFNAFSLALSLVLRTVDQDLPSLRTAAGGAASSGGAASTPGKP